MIFSSGGLYASTAALHWVAIATEFPPLVWKLTGWRLLSPGCRIIGVLSYTLPAHTCNAPDIFYSSVSISICVTSFTSRWLAGIIPAMSSYHPFPIQRGYCNWLINTYVKSCLQVLQRSNAASCKSWSPYIVDVVLRRLPTSPCSVDIAHLTVCMSVLACRFLLVVIDFGYVKFMQLLVRSGGYAVSSFLDVVDKSGWLTLEHV